MIEALVTLLSGVGWLLVAVSLTGILYELVKEAKR